MVGFAGDIFVHCRSDGTKIKFLSANTLHIIDRTMWLLPFGMEAKTPEGSGAEEETETASQGNGVGASGDGVSGAAAPVGA